MTAGQSRKGFDIDLRDGQAKESQLEALIKGTGARVEVKADYRATETGNVFLEFEQAGPPSYEARPSGVAITVAEWWATVLMDDGGSPFAFILRKTADMRALGRTAYRQGRTAAGGDHNMFRGVKVPLEWLLREAEPDPVVESVTSTGPALAMCGVVSPDGTERCGSSVGHVGPHRASEWVWPQEMSA